MANASGDRAPELYLGMDVGTTHVKAVAIDAAEGRVRSVAVDTTPETSDGYGPVHEADAIWGIVLSLAHDAWEKAGRGLVRGLGVASIGEEGFFVDAADRVLYPSPVWYAPRPSPAWEAFVAAHPAADIYRETGIAHHPIRSVSKWLWLRDHRPDVLRAARRWLSVSEYIVWRLGGEPVMSRSQASRTGVWSIARATWLESLVIDAGLPPDVLPEVVPSGTAGGTLRSVALGLPVAPGAPVVVAGHDHPVGAAAVGVREPGQFLDSLGTAESVMAPLSDPRPTEEDLRLAFEYGASAVGAPVYVMGAMSSGRFLRGIGRLLGEDRLEVWDGAAAAVPPGSEGLRFYPPSWDGRQAGRLEGWPADFRPEAVYRALLEGWAFSLRTTLHHLAGRVGTPLHALYAIGGGTQSRLSLRIRASVLGIPIRVVEFPEAVATGAAQLARWADLHVWPQAPTFAVVEPDPAWEAAYRSLAEETVRST